MRRRTFFSILVGAAACAGAGAAGWFLRSPPFGALPDAEDPALVASPHYRDGHFHNSLPTPILTTDEPELLVFARSLLEPRPRAMPAAPLPALRPDFAALAGRDVVVWLGHSSLYVQLAGVRLLVDPVCSPHAAPVPFSTRAFAGATPLAARDMPPVDAVLISHDHWDHLDYPTLAALRGETGQGVGRIICPLGVGAHVRHWGFAPECVTELDWQEETALAPAPVRVRLTESRHFSGRTLNRNRSLWGGFLLHSPMGTVFFSGDGGYGPHFAQLGRQLQEEGIVPDLALMDCGQYNPRWRHVHMQPEEAAQAARELGARALLPVHIGKFSLAPHPWDDPFKRVAAACAGSGQCLLTPRIGEAVPVRPPRPAFSRWWEGLD